MVALLCNFFRPGSKCNEIKITGVHVPVVDRLCWNFIFWNLAESVNEPLSQQLSCCVNGFDIGNVSLLRAVDNSVHAVKIKL